MSDVRTNCHRHLLPTSERATIYICQCYFYPREAPFVYIFFPHDISKTLYLESPNLRQKCSTMSPGNQFILGSKGQRPRSRVTKTLPAWVFAVCTLVGAS